MTRVTTTMNKPNKETIKDELVIVEVYHYSVPLAVDGTSRVLGLSPENRFDAMNALGPWVGTRATNEPVHWLTPYANPGLDTGVVLVETSAHPVSYERPVATGRSHGA